MLSTSPKYIPSNTSTSLVVDKVVYSTRANGENGYKLYGYTGGKLVKYFLSDEIPHLRAGNAHPQVQRADECLHPAGV